MANLKLHSLPDRPALDRAAADLILAGLREKPDLVLCVATGASTLGVYEQLTQHAAADPQRFQAMRICKLDEWLGLPDDDPGSCEAYIQRHVVGPWHMAPENYLAFDAAAPDPEAECDRMHHAVVRTGIDIALLGIGANGHVGLNEPADTLIPYAHIADLVPSTQQHAMLTHNRPTGGMTLGMAEIMTARQAILLAPGTAKNTIVQRLRKRQITTQFPATLFWLHTNTTCLTCPG